MLLQRRQSRDADLDLSAEEIGDHRTAALVRHVRDLDAALGFEELHRQVRRGAAAVRSRSCIAWIGLEQREELGQRARRHFRVDDDRIGIDRRERERLGRAQRVVRHRLHERGVDRVRSGDAHEQRVTVGLRLGDDVRAHAAAGARVVLDHDRLSPLRLELLADEARGDVGGAARAKGTTIFTGRVG